jgi:hypothetical protein
LKIRSDGETWRWCFVGWPRFYSQILCGEVSLSVRAAAARTPLPARRPFCHSPARDHGMYHRRSRSTTEREVGPTHCPPQQLLLLVVVGLLPASCRLRSPRTQQQLRNWQHRKYSSSAATSKREGVQKKYEEGRPPAETNGRALRCCCHRPVTGEMRPRSPSTSACPTTSCWYSSIPSSSSSCLLVGCYSPSFRHSLKEQE